MTFEDDKRAILALLHKLPYARFTIDADGEILLYENKRVGRTYVYLDNTVWWCRNENEHIDREKIYHKNNIEELFDLMFMERI